LSRYTGDTGVSIEKSLKTRMSASFLGVRCRALGHRNDTGDTGDNET
jgi:hypothetical protein